ncbi:MAG TPA: hypothetical protein VKQ70_13600 [Caulobacteraceae bacterium]|nr:hypothetical protein [Caulobacteraceae bacterium]
MKRAIVGLAGTAALGLALGGCATQPTYPLMTPIQVAQTFGYYDKPAESGGGRWQVSYVTPPVNAPGYRFDTTPTADQAKTMAFDLASLRAAQLAQQSGWQGFDVVDKHTSSDAEYVGPSWDYGAWGWGGWGGWHHRHWWWGAGWGAPGWGAGWGGGPGWDYSPPEQRLQAEAVLDIAFTNDVKPGQYRAADVLAQVSARYPNAFGPPPAGAPPVPPSAGPPPPAPPPKPTA